MQLLKKKVGWHISVKLLRKFIALVATAILIIVIVLVITLLLMIITTNTDPLSILYSNNSINRNSSMTTKWAMTHQLRNWKYEHFSNPATTASLTCFWSLVYRCLLFLTKKNSQCWYINLFHQSMHFAVMLLSHSTGKHSNVSVLLRM